jgi:coniferyl-aldehyde dehydrogenase
MPHTVIESQLTVLKQAEASERWAAKPKGKVAELLFEVASLFCEQGDAFSVETADQMGVTPAEVWLEAVFPSVWGLLSTACLFREASSTRDQQIGFAVGSSERWASSDFDAIANESSARYRTVRILPQDKFEALLLPEFRGYALIDRDAELGRQRAALALCLLPFNLVSIGVLDIVHLLCVRGLRVVAKISEKTEFVGPYLERIFAPFVRDKALLFLQGGPELGAELAARPEFRHVHLTGSARTAAKVEKVTGSDKLTCELGGVTPAIILPDALSTSAGTRHTARQLAFGALANNGQHCVSYQIALVPHSRRRDFEQTLWLEMQNVAMRGANDCCRPLIDEAAAQRLEGLLTDAQAKGAQSMPADARARGREFPVTLVRGVNQNMQLFHEEAFGPVIGVMGLEEDDFEQRALKMANSRHLSGDLAASIFTFKHESEQTWRMIGKLKHGIVTVNAYPGVAFATSFPWGAGPAGLSGRGWVHNYQRLPEETLRKVVLTAPLGRKGFGPLRWEDPWLLNVCGRPSLNFARALVQLTSAYFKRQYLRLPIAQMRLMVALASREVLARQQDQRRAH